MRPLKSTARHGDFETLSPERQEAIMRAAMEGFGRDSYKEASTEDIARKAGISKGLLFFYFRNKQELYLRTMNYLMERVVEWVVDEEFYRIDDFFELMLYSGEQKIASLQKWPWAFEFTLRAYYADHRDIRDLMANWTTRQVDLMFDRFFKNVDFSRFRDDVEPRKVLDMLIMLGDGYLHQTMLNREKLDLSDFMNEFRLWTSILRDWAYKREG